MSSIALSSDAGTPTADLATLRANRNRQNAQKSTGPRTSQGKKRSSQNARTHGLTSTLTPLEHPVPDPTAQLEFTTLKQELIQEHRPTTPTQHTLLDELTLIIWKLQYIPRIEHRLLNTPLPEDRPQTPQPNPQHLTSHPRLDNKTDPTAAIYALHLMQDQPTALTRLEALHHRLQARMNSLLNQLRRLRKDQELRHEDDQHLQRALRNAEVDRNLHDRAVKEANQRAPENLRAPARNEATSPSLPVALNPISPTMRDFPPSGLARNNQEPATFNADP